MKVEDTHWTMIAKYLKGELSDQERFEFSEWVRSHPENKMTFEQVKNLWISADQEPEFEIDLQENWQKFTRSIGIEHHGGPEATKKGKQIQWPRLVRVAAAASFLMLVPFIFFYLDGQDNMIAFETTKSEIRELYLPDSSKVVLNKGSKISYAADFNVHNRVVNLEGEAFFDVKKAEGYRFIVFAKNAKTEVFGTSFMVSAYDSLAQMEVKVATGKVALSLEDESNTVFLEPGSRGILHKETFEVKKAEVEHENFLSWKTKRLEYKNTSFSKVLRSLEDHFRIKFVLNSPDLYFCNYTGNFNNPDINSVLEVMAATMNFSFSEENGTYIITGPGCN